MIGFCHLAHLFSYLNVIKVAKWQSQSYLWKYAINYCMSFKEFENWWSNFLAPANIRVFWSHMPVSNIASDWSRTFLHPRCFCLAYIVTVLFARQFSFWQIMQYSSIAICPTPVYQQKSNNEESHSNEGLVIYVRMLILSGDAESLIADLHMRRWAGWSICWYCVHLANWL